MKRTLAKLSRIFRASNQPQPPQSQAEKADKLPVRRHLIVEALEHRIAPAALWVGKSTNYTITTDVGPAGLSAGDTVTWNPGVGTSYAGPVAGLTFGVNAFQTIDDAVAAANSGDILEISAGTFAETGHISKSLTLLGAQWGIHGESRSAALSSETILTGTGNGGVTPLVISANNVTVDGFLIEGQTNVNQFGGGIYLQPGTSGSVIQNNIVQNNVIGLFLANNSGTAQTVVQHNLFRDNTVPGAGSGTDIYADNFTAGSNLQNVLIQNNSFTNTTFQDSSWAIGISNVGATAFTDISVLNNQFSNAGRGAYFYNSSNVTFSGNAVDGATHYALGIFGQNGTPASSNFTISGNTITNSAVGFEVSDDTNPGTAYTGTLTISGTTFANTPVGVQNSSTATLNLGSTSVGTNLTVQSDTINFTGGANSVTGSGIITLLPATHNASIGINGAAGTLQITNADLLAINTTGANAFSGIVFGDASGADPIQYDTSSTYVFNVPVTFESAGVGGNIHIFGSQPFQTTGAGSTITIHGSGHTTTLSTDMITAGAAININDSVILAGDIHLDTTNGGGTPGGADIGITGTVDSDTATSFHALTLTAGTTGHASIGGAMGSTNALGNFTIASAALATLPQITTGSAGAVSITAAAIQLSGDINTGSTAAAGNVSFTGPVTLLSDIHINTASTTNGSIAFHGTVDSDATARALTLTAGTGSATFDNAVGGVAALSSLGVTAGSISVGANVTTVGTQTFNGPLTIAGAATLSTTNSAISLNGAVTLGANLTVSSGNGAANFASTVDGAFALLVNSTGTTTFGGAIGGTTALTSVTTNAGGTTALNGGSVTTTGAQTYNDTVSLGANTTLTSTTSGNVTFASAVDGAFSLAVNTSGITTFGSAVGGTTALTSISTDASGSTHINGGAIVTTGAHAYNDAVVLGANTVLTSTGSSNITLGSTVDGAFSLGVNTAGITTFGGVVGGINALTGITTDAGGSTHINGGSVTTTGTQTYNDAAVLGANTTLISTGAGNITLGSTVDGAFSLAVNTAGVTTFGGAVGATTALTSITTDAGGSTHINGGSIKTTGAHTYNDAVVLGASTTLTSTGSGNITFAAALDGAFALAVDTAGATTFTAAVGAVAALASLTTDAGGSTNINGGSIATTGAQTYNDAVLLGANTTLSSSGSGNINLASTVDGAFSLAVNTAGTTTFGGAVGATTALTSLSTNAGGSTNINGGAITTTGAQTYNDAVALGANTTLTSTGSGNVTLGSTVNGAFSLAVNTAGTTTFGGAVGATTALTSLSTNAGGSTNINGGTITTTGAQTYNDAVTLGANTTLTSTGSGNVTLGSTVNGAFSLAVNTAGTTTFGGTVGGSTALTSVTTDAAGSTNLNASVTTSGAQTYNDSVVLGGASTLLSTGSGNITLASTVNGAFGLIVTSNGSITFGGAMGGTTPLSALTVNGGTDHLNGGSIITSGAQTYNGTTFLGANTSLTNTTGDIAFTSSLDGGFALTVNTSGLATFAGPVGSGTPLLSVVTNAASTHVNGGLVATTGLQTYNNPVVLGANTTLSSSGSGTITLASTVDGAFSLAVNTAGLTIFTGAVGGITPLTSLSTNAGGSTNINGGAVTTTGAQSYSDAVTLGANTILASTGSGNITLGSTVDGAFSLTVNTAGTTTFGGAVGGTTALTSLTTNAGGSTNISAGSITTTGAQTYNDAVTLGANDTLTSTSSGNIGFASTINGGFGLTVNTAGTTSFTGAVGGTTALASLTTDAAGSTSLNGGSVVTTGAQTYNDAVTLGANTTLTSSGSGNITFASTVNGAFGLTANTAGTTTFGGAVGGTTALTSLTTDAPGSTAINGGSINTTGAQTLNDAVTLGANTTLTSTGSGNITLGSTVNGAFSLTANTSGVTTFGGIIGGTTALTSVTTDAGGSTHVNADVTTSGAQTYNDAFVLGNNVQLQSTGAGNMTFASTIDGAFGLIIKSTGTITLSSAVGGTTPLSGFTINGGVTHLNGGTVTTTGAQTYSGGVFLGANTTLTETGPGDISFTSAVDGAFSLTVSTPGAANFASPVGSITALTSLVTNAGTTNINGSSINTTGLQTYNNPVVVGANTTLSSSGSGNITFASTVNGASSLTVNTTGTTTFGGAVGGTTALASLTTDAGGTTIINGGSVTTSGAQSYGDAVTLGANTTFASTGSGNITFVSTVNGAFALTANTAGVTTLGGAVGGTTALTSVTTDAAGSTHINGGTINTTGAQTYNDAVVLGANTTLASTGSGNIALASTVDGAFALTVNTAGVTTFGGAVGGTTALTSITTNAGGSTAINGGAITTSGAQTYNDAVTLGADATLTTSGSAILFNSTVNGAHSLTATAGAGNVTFAGAVGGATALTGLTASGNNIAAAAVTTTGPISLTAQNNVTLNGAVNAGASTVTILANQDGAGTEGFTQNTGASITTTNNTPNAVSITVNTAGGGTGSISLGAIATGSTGGAAGGRVTINANAGSIVDVLTGPAINIASGNAILVGNGVGTAGTPIQTQVSNIEGTGGNGGFFANNTGSLQVGGISGVNGVSATSGNISLVTTGAFTVAEPVSTGAGSVQISSTGGPLAVNANVSGTANIVLSGVGVTQSAASTVDAGASLITINGLGSAINLQGTLATTSASASAIFVREASTVALGQVNAANGTLVLGAAGIDQLTGAVTQNAGTVLNIASLQATTGSSITLTNNNNIDSIATITAGGNVSVRDVSGNLNVGHVTASGSTVTLQNTSGQIVNTSGGTNITAAGALLQANSGIGSLATPITTAVSNLEAQTTTGGVFVNNTGALTIGGVSGVNGVSAGSGDIRITSGALTIAENIATSGNVTLASTGAITETTGFISGNLLTTSSVGGQLLKGNGVNRNAVAAFTATNSGAGTAILLLDNSPATLNVGNVTNPTGAVAPSGSNPSGDNILIDNVGNMDITGTVTSGSSSPLVFGGQITINSGGLLHLTSSGTVSSAPGGGGTLTLSSNVQVDGTATVGAGNVKLSGGAGTLVVNSPITTATSLVLQATDDVIINAVVTTTSVTADLTVTADIDGNTTGGVEITAAGQLNAGHNLTITGSDVEGTVGTIDGIRLDGNGTTPQLSAIGDTLLQISNTAPLGSEIWLGGAISGTQTGSITFNSNVHLFGPSASAITHGGGNILFTGTINGNSPLTLKTDFGQITFNAAVGNTTPLGDVTIPSALNVIANSSFSASSLTITSATGQTTFNGAVDLTGPNTNFSVTSKQLNIESTVNAHSGSILWNTDAIDISGNVASTGDLTIQPSTLNESIGINATGTLNLTTAEIAHLVDGFDLITIGHMNGSGAMNIGPVTFTDPVTLRSPNGAVTVTGEILGNDNAGITLGGKTIALNVNSPTPAIATQSNYITVSGAVSLLANTQITSSLTGTGGHIILAGTINGAFGLNVQAGTAGVVDVLGSSTPTNASIGGSAKLTSVTVSGGTVNLQPDILTSGNQSFTGTSSINLHSGGFFSTSGAISFSGPTVVSNIITVSTKSAGIAFNGTVDNVSSGGPGGLNIMDPTGTVTFNGNVGSTTPLASLKVNSAAQVTVNHGLAATGNITFISDETDLLGGVHSVSSPGAITFQTYSQVHGIHVGGASNVAGALTLTATDIAALADGFQSITIARGGSTGGLTVDAAGATFTDPVTMLQSLRSGTVTVSGPLVGTDNASFNFPQETVALGANITTAGGGITLGTALVSKNLTLSTSGGSIIATNAFTDVGGGHTLTLNAGAGSIQISKAVGSSAVTGRFGATSFTAGGIISFQNLYATTLTTNGGTMEGHGTVNTTAASGQTYNEAVALTASMSINSNNAPVHFASTIDAVAGKVASLTINSGTATTKIDGNIGSTVPLGALSFTSKNSVTLGGSTDATSLKINSPAFTVHDVTTSLGQVYTGVGTFSGALSGKTLSLTTTANVTNSASWDFTGVSTISATGHTINITAGSNNFGTLNLKGATGTIDVAGSINLGAVNLTSTTATFTVNAGGDVDGTSRIQVNALAITSGGEISLTAANAIKSLAGISAQDGVTILSGSTTLKITSPIHTVNGNIVIAGDMGGKGNVVTSLGTSAFQIDNGGRWVIYSASVHGAALSTGPLGAASTQVVGQHYPYAVGPTGNYIVYISM